MTSLHRLGALLLLAVALLGATDRFYDDLEADSPDGAFRVEAKSPDNQAEPRRPWQRHFTIRLIRRADKAVLWTIRQGDDDPSPVRLTVSASGAVIIGDGDDGLTLVDPHGVQRRLGDALARIPAAEVARFCDQTTAGTHWQQFSLQRFIRLEQREFFFIRLYWGSYLIYSLDGDRFDKPATCRRIEAGLVEECRRTVAEARTNQEPCPSCGGRCYRQHLGAALFVLKANRVAIANPTALELTTGNDAHWPAVRDYWPRLP